VGLVETSHNAGYLRDSVGEVSFADDNGVGLIHSTEYSIAPDKDYKMLMLILETVQFLQYSIVPFR
jgi:hypothetical protein